MLLKNYKYSFFLFLFLLNFLSCKTHKSIPPYGANGYYSKIDTNQFNFQTNTPPSSEINKEEAVQQNSNKLNNAQKTPSKSKKSKVFSKIDFCKLCQGYVLAKNAKKMLQPPQTKGCFAGIAMLVWVLILPLLVVIAGMLLFIAMLTIIFSTLVIAAIIAGIAMLILLGFGALTWFSGILTVILSIITAAFLLYWLCKKCN